MHARVVATLICLCGQSLAVTADTAVQITPMPPPQSATAATANVSAPPASKPTRGDINTVRAPQPAATASQASPRERGLMLAGIALMVGIALRSLGAGGP